MTGPIDSSPTTPADAEFPDMLAGLDWPNRWFIHLFVPDPDTGQDVLLELYQVMTREDEDRLLRELGQSRRDLAQLFDGPDEDAMPADEDGPPFIRRLWETFDAGQLESVRRHFADGDTRLTAIPASTPYWADPALPDLCLMDPDRYEAIEFAREPNYSLTFEVIGVVDLEFDPPAVGGDRS